MNSKPGMVHCIRCGAKRRVLPSGVVRCKSCDAARHALRYKANPEKYRAEGRTIYARKKNDPAWRSAVAKKMLNYNRTRLYGLPTAEYNKLLLAQGGLCAICAQPPLNQTRNDAMLHVDHAHGRNQARGLLCRNCNLGVGFFEDDPDLMERAAAYLRRAEDSTITLEQT